MDRFFLPPDDWTEAVLRGDEASHCSRVLRKREGDQIEVFDGAGRRATAVIRSLARREVVLDFRSESSSVVPEPAIELVVGIPKGKTMDLVIQKAVELGVQSIVPLLSENGNIRLEGKETERKAQKWQRVALEACKQCGQDCLPTVAPPIFIDHWLSSRKSADLEMAGALHEKSRPLKAFLRERRPGTIRWIVGPEGDFSEKEYHRLGQEKVSFSDLGPLVLRVETAVMAGLAAIRYEFA